MTRAFPILLLLLTLSITGQQIDTITRSFGIPNIVTGLRETLLIFIFISTLTNFGFFKNKRLSAGLLLLLFFSVAYLLISAAEEQYFLGFFYMRTYAIPIIYLVIFNTIFQNMTYKQLLKVLKLIGISNVIVITLAFLLYAYLQFFPSQKALLFGSTILPSAWIISGGTFMRMGLPLASPNSLGIYAALMLLLFFYSFLALGAKKEYRIGTFALIVMNLLALLCSLSRSSILVVILSLLLLPIIPAFRQSLFFFRFIIGIIIFASISSVALLIVEFVSDGYLSLWLELNMSGKDPSMQGHFTSIMDALRNFSQYYLYGYDRGTVGPKAVAATAVASGIDFYNVENSILGTMFDMGLIGAVYFWLNYALLLSATYQTRFQLFFLIPFIFFLQILPYIFAQEIVSVFILVYSLVGHLGRVGFFHELLSPHKLMLSAMPTKTKLAFNKAS